jgi:hypothetical protein
MNLTPSGGKRAQTYFVVTTIAFSASVAASLLYFDPIYRGVRRILSWSGEGPIVAITAVAVLLVTRSFVRRSHGDFPARKLRRQIMFSILYLYLLTGVLVGLSREDSFLQTMSSQSRTRLALFLGFVSAVSLIASLIVVALIRVRERNRFSSWEMELRWNLLLAEHTARELKVLKLREVQWLGTSLALSKLIWSPLGSNAQKGPALAPPEFTSSLKKFQIAKLEINAEGLHFLSARTRRVFANRGWLHGQYERAVKSFALRYARRMGTDSSDVLVGRPESCSFPETLENLSRGELTSRRWEFARSLISGEHDMTLQNDGVSQVAHSAFREVLEKPELHSFHCGDHGSVKEFILQLDDSHMGQGELPAKIVSLAPLSFSGANAKPECYWWFPKDDFECSNLAAVNSSIPIEFSRAVIMSGKLEVSAPVLLSDLVQIASSSNDEDLYEQGDGL